MLVWGIAGLSGLEVEADRERETGGCAKVVLALPVCFVFQAL